MLRKEFTTASAEETMQLGQTIGTRLKGGEIIEFFSDLGGGKTTFTKGLAQGFGSPDPVASPSFTISFVYTNAAGKQLHHFDFYRLSDPGIIANELAEVEGSDDVVVVVEWGEVVEQILPEERIKIEITSSELEDTRNIKITYPEKFSYLFS